MARIPDQEVQRLKEEIAVQCLVETDGIELKKVGKDLSGKCPFHADYTASLVVTQPRTFGTALAASVVVARLTG